ncbi:MAG: hypothetical protein WAN05_31090, partial [Roseiarcus sp.]
AKRCGRHGQAFGLPNPPTAEQNQKKRTLDALPKPDNLIRYRQEMPISRGWYSASPHDRA